MQSNQEFSKLEKADILELVVRQLKSPSAIQSTPPQNHPTTSDQSTVVFYFQSGVKLCADETINYLQQYSPASLDDCLTSFNYDQSTLVERIHCLKDSLLSQETSILATADTTAIDHPKPASESPLIANNDAGVLLDLSCNNRSNQIHPSTRTLTSVNLATNNVTQCYANRSEPPINTNSIHTGAKREVLWKIRRKILEKRLAQQCRGQIRQTTDGRQNVDDGFMWRPW